MGTDKTTFEGDRGGSDHCACLTRSDRKRSCPEVTWLFPSILFPYFFSYFFFPYICYVLFFPVLSFPYFFSVLFQVATLEIERFKTSVSCFSSTCRYITVHVPYRIAIQTSPAGLHLVGWGARMRDLKRPTMNFFNLKEDWNVLYYQPITSLEKKTIRSRYFGRLPNQIVRIEYVPYCSVKPPHKELFLVL